MSADGSSWYRGKNVLVTGGAGLIGQGLVRRLLADGAYVRATQYRARTIALRHPRLEIVPGDLREEAVRRAAFRDMEVAFLAAAWVGGAKTVRADPSALIMYNLDLQSKLIHAAAAMKVSRCGFVSSTYVYPDTGRPNVESEGFIGDPWIPTNYGLGWIKRYLETLCRHFQLVSSTAYAIVRPSTAYGPHDHFDLETGHAIPSLIMKAVARMDPFEVWGNGEDVRTFVYVDDLVDGFLRAVERDPIAEAVNLGARQPHTIKEVVRLLLDVLGFWPAVVFSTDKPSAIPYKVSDPSRALERLGWAATVSLEEGLRRTVDWYVASRPAAAQGAVAEVP